MFTVWELKQDDRTLPSWISAGKMYIRSFRVFPTLHVSKNNPETAAGIKFRVTSKLCRVNGFRNMESVNGEDWLCVCVCVCVCVYIRIFALPVLHLCVSVYYRHTEKCLCLPVCLENLPIYLENWRLCFKFQFNTVGFLLVFLYSEHHGAPSHTHYWHPSCSFAPNEFKAEFFRKERVSCMTASYDHMYNLLCHFRIGWYWMK